MKKTILLFSILLASCAGKQTQEIRTMERLSTASRNDYYVSNRAPLQPLQFIKLPAGRRCVVIPDAPSFFSLTIKIGSFF